VNISISFLQHNRNAFLHNRPDSLIRKEGKRWAAVVGGWESILYVCSKMGGLFLTSVLVTLGAPFWKDVMNALAGAKKVIPKTAG